MKKTFNLLLVITFLSSFSSCALIFNGTGKRVKIVSNTPESKIYVDGSLVGTEQASVKLKRNQDHTIVVKKDGCKTEIIPLDKQFQIGWVFFYFFINPLALITDGPTGAWYGFDRNQVVVPELDCGK